MTTLQSQFKSIAITQDEKDPGVMPDDLLRIPGYISRVMDYCMETAPYPNQALAFAGALSLQAFFVGRKARDPGDNRSNIYLLALAHSASGKDWPRKLNAKILYKTDQGECLGDAFASGEGLQDALHETPSMIFQSDEFDTMLRASKTAKDGRFESILNTLLKTFSSSNSVMQMRKRAGGASNGTIDQPSLTIFGTAIPSCFYSALSPEMLVNGILGRMIIIEAGARGSGQQACPIEVPDPILSIAQYWKSFQPPRRYELDTELAVLAVPYTGNAQSIAWDFRMECDEYRDHYARFDDDVRIALWGRASEYASKLALIYACSENHKSPVITPEAVQWSTKFMMHQVKRMLFMVDGYVSASQFDADCLAIKRKLREAGQPMAHQTLLKRMKVPAKMFRDLVHTLEQRGEVIATTSPTSRKPAIFYQLNE